MFFKEDSKIDTAARWSPTLFQEGVLFFCFVAFMYTLLKNIGGKSNNSLLLEKIIELAKDVESL